MKRTLFAAVWALVPSLALAQAAPQSAPPVDADAPNLVHARHLHPHHPPHATVPADASRFTTSRSSSVKLALPREDDASFSFVVFGDRTTGPTDGVNVLADAVRDVNLIEPDLVMTIGDLVQGYNEAPQWNAQAREYKAIMDRLVCPWFPTAGNHDVYWRDRDNSGDAKPAGEHESSFEATFGPLWYAFEHKNAWFIVLFTDEGDAATNAKGFGKPELQKMSDAQFEWLKATLAKAKKADHVFVFQHHPRWTGTTGAHGGYGDGWDRVHQALVEAGNVRAVFAGHIHYMRYDKRDGIDYLTLATTGGRTNGSITAAGQLHHYNVVNVRKHRVSMAAYPVGAALDVRDLSSGLVKEIRALQDTKPNVAPIKLSADGSAKQTVRVAVSNPAKQPVTFGVGLDSKDSRWTLPAEPQRKTLAAGESAEFALNVSRKAGTLDDATRLVELVYDVSYATPTHDYPIPTQRLPLAIDASAVPADANTVDQVLALDGTSALPVAAPAGKAATLEQFTLEARFRARSYKKRNGLLSKMQNSAYGIFVSEGRPAASVRVGGSYLSAKPKGELKLDTDRWYHVAQVYDGRELRLYVDGKLVAQAERAGSIQDNDLPLIVGGDVGRGGVPVDTLDGDLDAIRLSNVARYTGDSFTPAARHQPDAKTLLLLNVDRRYGPWLLDESPEGRILPLPTGVDVRPAAAKLN